MKYILLVLALSIGTISFSQSLVVEKKDNTSNTFSLTEIRKLTFISNSTVLRVGNKSGANTDFAISGIAQLNFGTSTSLSSDALLKSLTTSNGVLNPVFTPNGINYTVTLPPSASVVPTVSATANDANATVAITQASSLTGTEAQRTATVTVTAEDGTTTKTYTVVFFVLPEEGKDATLKSLTTSEGALEPDFSPGVQNYTVKLPPGTLGVPQTTAEPNDSNAMMEIVEATNLERTLFERTTTITVTAADGITQLVYTIVFDNESEVVEVVLNPHNQFSPNGDLLDDTWFIENIDLMPQYEVVVFNRVGQEVFRSKAYQNDWDGTSNGKQLLPATYYFVIRNEKGENVESGSVNLIR